MCTWIRKYHRRKNKVIDTCIIMRIVVLYAMPKCIDVKTPTAVTERRAWIHCCLHLSSSSSSSSIRIGRMVQVHTNDERKNKQFSVAVAYLLNIVPSRHTTQRKQTFPMRFACTCILLTAFEYKYMRSSIEFICIGPCSNTHCISPHCCTVYTLFYLNHESRDIRISKFIQRTIECMRYCYYFIIQWFNHKGKLIGFALNFVDVLLICRRSIGCQSVYLHKNPFWH